VTPEKSDEIVAFRCCLTLLALEDAIVSIRAIGCRRDMPTKSWPGRPISPSPSNSVKRRRHWQGFFEFRLTETTWRP
jgi:hypothetical protein